MGEKKLKYRGLYGLYDVDGQVIHEMVGEKGEEKTSGTILKDLMGVITPPDVGMGSPTIGELLQVLGYETIYEALKAVVKEKGLWKDEWAKKEWEAKKKNAI